MTALFYYFTFFKHQIIYTTNPIEGVHRQIRKITKTKGAFSSEQALMKLMYLVIKNISKNGRCPSIIGAWLFRNFMLDLGIEFSGNITASEEL